MIWPPQSPIIQCVKSRESPDQELLARYIHCIYVIPAKERVHPSSHLGKLQGHPLRIQLKNLLNIALLNVVQYLVGRYRHIFIPYKFSTCSDFLAESLVIRKLQGKKLTLSKISARKKASENSRLPFQGKNEQLYHFQMGSILIHFSFKLPDCCLDVRKSYDRQARKKFYKKMFRKFQISNLLPNRYFR